MEEFAHGSAGLLDCRAEIRIFAVDCHSLLISYCVNVEGLLKFLHSEVGVQVVPLLGRVEAQLFLVVGDIVVASCGVDGVQAS